MIDWLHNPHADYVLTCYGLALLALLGLGLTTWYAARKVQKQLQSLSKKS